MSIPLRGKADQGKTAPKGLVFAVTARPLPSTHGSVVYHGKTGDDDQENLFETAGSRERYLFSLPSNVKHS